MADLKPLIVVVILLFVLLIVYYYNTPTQSTQYPGGLKEGQLIRCATDRGGAIFKLENGMKRWVPSAEAYAKLGSPGYTDVPEACGTAIPEGIQY